MTSLSQFRRGKDKKPRKRPIRRHLNQAGGIAGNTAMQGLAGAGTLGTVGLLATPNNAAIQGRLARTGLALGAGYGLYQGIKKLRQRQRRLPLIK